MGNELDPEVPEFIEGGNKVLGRTGEPIKPPWEWDKKWPGHTPSTLRFLSLNFLREKIWHTTLDTAKLRRRTFYQTRHTFASNALAAGENPKWVADMLGHKSTQILFDVYEKFIPRRTRLDGSALLARMTEEARHGKNATESLTSQKLGSEGGVGSGK